MNPGIRTVWSVFAAALLLTACSDPGREPGDDPTRSDDSPGEGRPIDPQSQRPSDEPAPAAGDTNTRGTLDGSSDEVTSPEQPQPNR